MTELADQILAATKTPPGPHAYRCAICVLRFTPRCVPCVAKTGVRCPACGALAEKVGASES